jgi:isopentenyl-diphosphate delta-isomerase
MTGTETVTESGFTQIVQSLGKAQVLESFDEVTPLDSKPTSKGSATDDKTIFAGHDAEQIRLMEEVCIVLDYDDKPIAAGSKKTCMRDTDFC